MGVRLMAHLVPVPEAHFDRFHHLAKCCDDYPFLAMGRRRGTRLSRSAAGRRTQR